MTAEKRSLWHLIEAVAVAMAQGYGLARTRALGHPAPVKRLLAQRDHVHTEAVLLERELAVFRAQRLARPPRRRPQFAPEQRAEILQLAALRGWTAKEAAARFGLHPNTIRNWKKALRDKGRAARLLGEPPWNRLHAAVRRTVHEIRRLCPEREFGTRTIARHMIRAGIRISRTSVRRILEEGRASPSPRVAAVARRVQKEDRNFDQLFKPDRPHAVWHIDLTEIRVLWRRFEVAAVLDGYSRKLLALRVFAHRPTSEDLIRVISHATAREKARPRFLISDQGSQFRRRFRDAYERRGITHVRGRVGAWRLNGKIERFFRTFKSWQRGAWMFPSQDRVQRRLDAFHEWYNRERPHSATDGMTPAERVRESQPKEPTLYLQRGGTNPEINVNRRNLTGDPRLPVLEIRVRDGPTAA